MAGRKGCRRSDQEIRQVGCCPKRRWEGMARMSIKLNKKSKKKESVTRGRECKRSKV